MLFLPPRRLLYVFPVVIFMGMINIENAFTAYQICMIFAVST